MHNARVVSGVILTCFQWVRVDFQCQVQLFKVDFILSLVYKKHRQREFSKFGSQHESDVEVPVVPEQIIRQW